MFSYSDLGMRKYVFLDRPHRFFSFAVNLLLGMSHFVKYVSYAIYPVCNRYVSQNELHVSYAYFVATYRYEVFLADLDLPSAVFQGRGGRQH